MAVHVHAPRLQKLSQRFEMEGQPVKVGKKHSQLPLLSVVSHDTPQANDEVVFLHQSTRQCLASTPKYSYPYERRLSTCVAQCHTDFRFLCHSNDFGKEFEVHAKTYTSIGTLVRPLCSCASTTLCCVRQVLRSRERANGAGWTRAERTVRIL